MDKLIIDGLQASCRIGVTDAERAKPQTVWVDLELVIDAASAAARDGVQHAVDYARLVDAVARRIQQGPVNLLETLAERIAADVLKEFPTPRVTVRVKKRALPGIDHAAVEITRQNPV